jgi:hypothetical protein
MATVFSFLPDIRGGVISILELLHSMSSLAVTLMTHDGKEKYSVLGAPLAAFSQLQDKPGGCSPRVPATLPQAIKIKATDRAHNREECQEWLHSSLHRIINELADLI